MLRILQMKPLHSKDFKARNAKLQSFKIFRYRREDITFPTSPQSKYKLQSLQEHVKELSLKQVPLTY